MIEWRLILTLIGFIGGMSMFVISAVLSSVYGNQVVNEPVLNHTNGKYIDNYVEKPYPIVFLIGISGFLIGLFSPILLVC